MKSKLLTCSLIALASLLPAKAQNYMFDNPENHTYLGARVALNVSTAANGGAFYSSKPGFDLGAVYHIPVKMNFYFEPGLSIFYNVFGTSRVEYFYPGTVTEEGTPIGLPYQVDGTIRNFGFRIPLNLGYHFDISESLKVYAYTGPQLDLSLIARYHQNEVLTPAHEVEKGSSQSIFGTGGFKHFDLGWNLGIGLQYDRYTLSIGGTFGMTKMKSASIIPVNGELVNLHRDLRRNIFTLALGYNF